MTRRPGPTVRSKVLVVDGEESRHREEVLVTEEPLEIRLSAGAETVRLGITVRTPGHDVELTAGLLHAEGLLPSPPDVLHSIAYCTDPDVDPEQRYNTVTARLRGSLPDLGSSVRRSVTTAACGVCGRASLDDLAQRGLRPLSPGPRLDPDLLLGLPDRLRALQAVFDRTGGLHAAGVFRADGTLLVAREDVGRHNAVDKAVGRLLLDGTLPAGEAVLAVSGRAGYEILQKALAAGIPAVVAVSAASSLAVDLARRFGMTLAGFVRDRRMTVYSGEQRLELPARLPG